MDVHDLEVSTWAPALLKPSLYNDKQVSNFFYNDVKPLTNNKVKVYLDIDFRFLGENGINSIPSVPDEKGGFKYTVPVVHMTPLSKVITEILLRALPGYRIKTVGNY